jgi:hypothetical protein
LKNYTLLVIPFVLFCFISCGSSKKSINSDKKSTEIKDGNRLVGNDKDDFGCIPSAGYTWSLIKKECIRVFELELQLKTLDEKSIIGAIFSEDKNKAEVFTKDGSITLNTLNGNYYEEKDFFLKNENGNWVFGTLRDKKISHKQYVTH